MFKIFVDGIESSPTVNNRCLLREYIKWQFIERESTKVVTAVLVQKNYKRKSYAIVGL